MKNFIKEFSQGLYDALEKSDSPNCFSLEEIETFAWNLFRSFINKTAVLMGIFIVSAYFFMQGKSVSQWLVTAIIFWVAWLLSTSVVLRFYKEWNLRKK